MVYAAACAADYWLEGHCPNGHCPEGHCPLGHFRRSGDFSRAYTPLWVHTLSTQSDVSLRRYPGVMICHVAVAVGTGILELVLCWWPGGCCPCDGRSDRFHAIKAALGDTSC